MHDHSPPILVFNRVINVVTPIINHPIYQPFGVNNKNTNMDNMVKLPLHCVGLC